MVKLAILKFSKNREKKRWEAELKLIYPGLLQYFPQVIRGELPLCPQPFEQYQAWQNSYHRLGGQTRRLRRQRTTKTVKPGHRCKVSAQHPLQFRIKAKRIVYNGHINGWVQDCKHLAAEFEAGLNEWLRAESFAPIAKTLQRECAKLTSPGQLLIQTSDRQLRQFPWHRWQVIADRWEVALGPMELLPAPKTLKTPPGKVRILVILGDSRGIDLAEDQQLLETLPHVEPQILNQPDRSHFNDQLWEQAWDILFFAGHSQTQQGKGVIDLNPEDSLTLDELRYGVKKAIQNGLQLAIFNSCDGWGLLEDLEALQIPQLIVMREPIPDRVAHSFLKYFLGSFSQNQSFVESLHTARQRLQGLEKDFPCATWLPTWYQANPWQSPNWEELQGSTVIWQRNYRRTVIWVSLAVTLAVVGIRNVGLLQPWELQVYDGMLRLRPTVALSAPVTVITIDEPDITDQEIQKKTLKGSLSHEALETVLKQVMQYSPRAIGVDIVRETPHPPQFQELIGHLQTNDRLFMICHVYVEGDTNAGYPPPPESPLKQVGFVNVSPDPDVVLRRQIVMMGIPPESSCKPETESALSTLLALKYLKSDIDYQKYPQYFQLGQAKFRPLSHYPGPYHRVAGGIQVLLNYSPQSELEKTFTRISLTEVLEGKLKPEQVRDRVVLVGAITSTTDDRFATPYSRQSKTYQKLPGVFVHAQMVNYLIQSAQGKVPALSPVDRQQEYLWIALWSLIGGGGVGWNGRRKRRGKIGLWLTLGCILIGTIAQLGFQIGLWLPVVPPILAFMGTIVAMESLSSKLGDRNFQRQWFLRLWPLGCLGIVFPLLIQPLRGWLVNVLPIVPLFGGMLAALSSYWLVNLSSRFRR